MSSDPTNPLAYRRLGGSITDIVGVCKEDLKLENPTLISTSVQNVQSSQNPDIPADSLSFYGILSHRNDVLNRAIKVYSIDHNILQNGLDHNTYQYDLMRNVSSTHLVVRRGKYFSLLLEISRSIDPAIDKLLITFEVKDCAYPKSGNGTKVLIPVSFYRPLAIHPQSWTAYCEPGNHVGKWLRLYVYASSSAIVHKWKMSIDSSYHESKNFYACRGDIYLLFNAWCKDDDSFIEKDEKRNEYILSDSGLLFKGTPTCFDKRLWKFGQYEKLILECSLVLLTDIAKIPFSQCSNALQVAIGIKKALSASRFIEKVSGKKTFFLEKDINNKNGSKKILQHFYKSGIPIKNANCSLKAGIIVTVMRCLGIASRAVTCFRFPSSEDPPSVIDFYYSEKGMEPLEGTDMIKEYTYWAEVHITRSDFRDSHGWNYLDELYGPLPVEAIKHKLNLVQFDAALLIQCIFSEVHYWKILEDKRNKYVSRGDNRICPKMLTKKLGSWEDDDITDSYKKKKAIVTDKKGRKLSITPSISSSHVQSFMQIPGERETEDYFTLACNDDSFCDIYAELRTDSCADHVLYGCPFKIEAIVMNKAPNKTHTVFICWQIWSRKKHSKKLALVKRTMKTIQLQEGASETDSYQLRFEDYVKKLSDSCIFEVLCMIKVEQNDYDIILENQFYVRMPDLPFRVLGELELYKKAIVEVHFVNTTPLTLEQIKISLSEADCQKKVNVRFNQLKPNQRTCARFSVVPYFLGKYTLSANMIADNIETDTFMEITVTK